MYERRSCPFLIFLPMRRYPEAVMAPRRANPSPINASLEMDVSPKLITPLPKMERVIPRMRFIPTGSLKKSQAPNPTKRGLVETRTTELATEVNFNEAIQKAKWRARKMPERINHRNSDPFHPFQPLWYPA